MATQPADAVSDNTELYEELASYPWDQDKEFQGGLQAILGNTTSPAQIQELTIRAQCFYISRKKNISVDFNAYKAYLSEHPTSQTVPQTPPHISQPHIMTPPSSSSTSTYASTNSTDAPYPSTFAEIVALIQSGAPIAGIKDIPPTILPEQATKPLEKKRRKPWEKDVPEAVVQGAGTIDEETGEKVPGTFGDRRDEVIVQELPEGV